jgi:hypothetical protein
MKQLQIVSPAYVHQLWGDIKHFFEASCESCTTGDINADQLKAQLATGAQSLFVITNDEGKITGVASVEITNLPNHRVAQITGLGGKDIVGTETFSQFEDWAKAQGVTKIRAWAREPQARLYKKVGLDAAMIVVEKML